MIVSLGHSYVEAQEINTYRVLRRRDSHSAAHKTGCQQSAGTTNYVISAKLVPSFRRHSLKDFERPKSGFTFLFVKFLLSFRNKDIISYKILQKFFLLYRHFKLNIMVHFFKRYGVKIAFFISLILSTCIFVRSRTKFLGLTEPKSGLTKA